MRRSRSGRGGDARSGAPAFANATPLVVTLFLAAAVVAVGLGAGVGAAAGGGGTNHTSCTTISSEGLHVLTSDVTDAGTTYCIEITASNVTFDGKGHTIDGVDRDSSSRGIYVQNSSTATNVTVRNVTVTNWETGVYLQYASNGTVRNVTASNSRIAGFNLFEAQNNTLEHVTVTGGDDAGIYFSSLGTNNVVANSTVVDNAGAAVFMDSWSGDVPTNRFENLAIGNSTAPNTTLSFTGRAVVLDSVSSPAADPPGWVNASRYLNVTGIVGSSYLNLTLDYDDGDVVGEESSLVPFKNDSTGWNEIAGSSVDAGADELSVNLTSVPVSSSYPVSNWSVVGAFANDPSEITDCGAIDSAGAYALAQNVTDSSTADCIEITASDVTLDGMGHTVDTGPGGKGIYPHGPVSNLTIRNLTVTNGDQGVHVGAGTNGTVVRNVTVRNVGSRAIVLRGGNATVTDTVIEDPGTRGVLGTENGKGAVVSDTVIRDAGTKGLRLQSNTTLVNVTVEGAAEEGINLEVGATLTVRNSTITESGSHGIWSEPGTLAVRNSTVNGSGGAGIYVERSGDDPTVVDGTVVTNSTNAGIRVGPGVSNTALTGVTLAGNGGEDLRIDGRATGSNVALNGSTVAGFVADAADLSAVASSPSAPADTTVQGAVVDAGAAGGSLDLTLPYTEPGGSEAAVSAWRYDGDWTKLDTSRDAGANTVSVTGVSTDTTVAVLHNAGPYFVPTIDSASSPVRAGTTAMVNVTVENTGANGGTRAVNLTANGSVVDSVDVTLAAGATGTATLTWDTTGVPSGDHQVTASTDFESASSTVTVWSEDVAACGELFVSAAYRLTGNLASGDGSDCLVVTASNVTIDGMGHTIDAGPGGYGVHLVGPVTNVTVRNVTVENGDRGIQVAGAPGTNVTDAVVRNAATDGVYLDSDTTLTNVTITGSGGHGVTVERDSGASLVVRNGTVNGSAEHGIFVDDSDSLVRIVGTVVGDNDDAGAHVDVSTLGDVFVEDSLFTGNGRVGGTSGVWVQAGNATFRNTTVLDSGKHGFDVRTWTLGELSTVFRNNTASDNARDGFFVDAATNNVSFVGDSASGNGGVAFDLEVPANATNVGLNGTIVSFSADNAEFDSGGATLAPASSQPAPPPNATVQGPFVNATVSDGTLDLTLPYTEPSGLEKSVAIWRYDGDWTSLQVDTTHDTDANTVATTDVASNGTYAVLFRASPFLEPTIDDAPAVVERGETLAVDATVESLADIGDTQTVDLTVDGSVVDSRVVTVAANASESLTLNWSTTGASTGVRTVAVRTGNASDEVTVDVQSEEVIECREVDRADTYRLTGNLSFGGSDDCLAVTGSDVVVDGMGYTIDAGADGRGVTVEGSISNVTVRNLTVANGNYGIYAESGPANVTIANVTVRSTDLDSITLAGPNVTVTGSHMENPGRRGVDVDPGADGAVIADSVVRNTGTYGIRPRADTTVRNVTVESAGTDGIELADGPSVTVLDATITDASEDGIEVLDGSLSLQNSTVAGSGDRGISVSNSGTVTVDGSAVNDSDGSGLRVFSTAARAHVEDAVIAGNGKVDGVPGVHVSDTPATLANTTVLDSGTDGFHVTTGGHPVAFAGNLARNNANHGFLVGSGSQDVSFDGDAVAGNDGQGFRVEGEANGTDVGLNGTTVAGFAAEAVALSPVATTPAPPTNATGFGRFVNATDVGASASLDLTLSYAETGDPEEWVSVWRYDGNWTRLDGRRNTSADTVTATNVSSFSTLAAFSKQPPAFFAPTVDAVDPANATVEMGESLAVTAIVENLGAGNATQAVTLTANGSVVDSRDLALGPGASATVTLTWSTANATAGTYTAVVATANATASRTATVDAVEEVPDGDDEDGNEGGGDRDGNGGGGGAGGGGGGGGGSPTVSAAVPTRTDTGVTIAVVNARPGTPARTTLPAVGAGGVTYDQLSISFAESAGSFDLEFTPLSTRPEAVPEVDVHATVAYFRVSGGPGDERVESATISFSLDDGALPPGADPSDVAVLRRHDGRWQRLETERVGDGYRARMPGFSTFAVVVDPQETTTATATTTPTTTDSGSTTAATTDTSATATTGDGSRTATGTVGETAVGAQPGFVALLVLLGAVAAAVALLIARRE